MNGLPIAMQANQDNEASYELALLVEIAESVLDFGSGMLARFKKNQAKLSEKQKLLLAQNPLTAAEILLQLSSDQSSEVRNAVLQNPASPSQVIKKLAADKDAFIRAEARMMISLAA
ncbi:MAG: hypothetical protein K2X27_24865 [Candidatus Obscuribacterales bacterium]|nr:hypothetical protein [Candidatus Obscuribacterales bacterium]